MQTPRSGRRGERGRRGEQGGRGEKGKPGRRKREEGLGKKVMAEEGVRVGKVREERKGGTARF